MFHTIITERIGLQGAPTWKSYIIVLHPVMYLSTKSSIFFPTARAFAVILPASLSARYLNVASDYSQ